MSQTEAERQFKSVILADLNRWSLESDLNAEQLASVVVSAVDEWLDDDVIGFEPEDEGKTPI